MTAGIETVSKEDSSASTLGQPQARRLRNPLLLSSAVVASIGFLLVILFVFSVAPLVPDVARIPERSTDEMTRGYPLRVKEIISSGERCSTLMLGSSLTFFPNLMADAYYENAKLPMFNMIEYTDFAVKHVRALHVESLLFGQSPERPEVLDFGTPGSMVSDSALIYDKLIEFGKRPQIIILAIAPRDFIDNNIDPDKTPVKCEFRTLISWTELVEAHDVFKATLRLADFAEARAQGLARDFKRQATRIYEFIRRRGKPAYVPPQLVLVDKAPPGVTLITFPVRAMKLPDPKAARKGKPETYYMIRSQSRRLYLGDNRLQDLSNYKERYNPPDRRKFKEQKERLRAFLARAQALGTRVVMVDMPLPRENLALLDRQIAEEYRTALETFARDFDVLLVKPALHDNYELGDFLDACHLNAIGGHKCFGYVAECMKQHSATAERLAQVVRSNSTNH